ncbi:MAG: heavy-metal-associated domain-containing protein [Salinibacter sp.]
MNTQDRTLRIDGMHCGHCVDVVEEALDGLDGVTVQDVDVGSAQVAYAPAEVSDDALAAALDDAGYELSA